MADKTGIEWTRGDDGTPGATWNPVTGCTKVSAGCDHCYAETFAERWRGVPGHYFENGFDVQLRPDKLALPLRWRRPRRIFVNSMSDLFHDQVPDDYIARVWGVMAWSPHHTYQILTKRHGRMRALLNSRAFKSAVDDAWYDVGRAIKGAARPKNLSHPYDRWPLPNVHLGVSAENQRWAGLRIPALLETPAAVHWVSLEPLLGPVVFEPHWLKPTVGCARWTREPTPDDWHALESLARALVRKSGGGFIDWVVAGGESGRGARPMHLNWVRSLRDQCQSAGVPFLFKQHGAWAPWYSHGEGEDGPGDTFVNPDGSTGHVWFNESLGYPTNWAGDWTAESQCVSRVGKGRSGRELDGRTWDEYPQAVAP